MAAPNLQYINVDESAMTHSSHATMLRSIQSWLFIWLVAIRMQLSFICGTKLLIRNKPSFMGL
ncbi:hypothetical protein BP00DRAFT_222109 [Aspergillus indologenus CBS 114.80]|uniref:Uncharacterized protein n=1 Tax=Aspergillus indologenus CBS 114.80 TaxID=1450541 RepID=A0A2V5I1D0_9EURO|nr:hypothetical protein BP00DRAFT_222109 [Aspergillus indologenus CBS 114.80]